MTDVEIGILGPVRLVVGGRTVTPRRTAQRLFLARLAVDAGRPVGAQDLLSAADEGVTGRPAERVDDDLADLVTALRDADPARVRLERTGTGPSTTWTLHLGPGVLDLDRFRAERNAAMDALDAGDLDDVDRHLDRAVALFPRPALDGLPGRWAQGVRADLELEALEVHAVLADRLRRRDAHASAARLVALHERFSPPSPDLWAALVRDRLDAGADDVLASLVREVRHGLRSSSDVTPLLRTLLATARRRVAAAGIAGADEPWVYDLEFRLFGPFRVLVQGEDRTPDLAPALAALVVSRGRTVPWDELARAVFPGRSAGRHEEQVRKAVLRLSPMDRTVPPRVRLVPKERGWRLVLPDPCTDLDLVNAFAARGTELLLAGRAREAVEPLSAAASVCRPTPLAGFEGPWFEAARRRLDERAETVAVALATALVDGVLTTQAPGRETAVAWLEWLVQRHPGSLALEERLMTGYHLVGRDRDAVAVHDQASSRGAAFAGTEARTMTDLRTAIDAAAAPVPVELRVLDGVRVETSGRAERLRDPARRRALAALLLRHGGVLPAAELAQAAWGAVPADARVSTARLVEDVLTDLAALVRRATGSADDGLGRPALSVDAVPPDGWTAVLAAQARLDLDAVRDLADRGSTAWQGGDAAAAAQALRAAVSGLPASPLPDVEGHWFTRERARLVAWRDELVARCVRAELACGRYAAALPDLERLAATAPVDEARTADLVTALAALGRPADARAAYERCAAALRVTLGTSPGPTLRMLVRSRLGDA